MRSLLNDEVLSRMIDVVRIRSSGWTISRMWVGLNSESLYGGLSSRGDVSLSSLNAPKPLKAKLVGVISPSTEPLSLDPAEGGSIITEKSSELGIKYAVGSRGSEVVLRIEDVSPESFWKPFGMGGAIGGTDIRRVGGETTFLNTLRK